MANLDPVPGPAVLNTAPAVDEYGLVVRVAGGVVVVGPVAVTQASFPWIVSDPPLEAAIDVLLSSRASETTLAALTAIVAAGLDVPLSTRASETTLLTRAAASQLPAALVGGRLDTNVGAWLGSTAPTVGQKTMANSVPVAIASDQPALPITGAITSEMSSVGTLANGAETVVAAAAVSVLAANAARKSFIIQNVGIGNVRVGIAGVTPTTGFRLGSGESRSFNMPWCPTNAIFAIREGAVNSIVLAQEIT